MSTNGSNDEATQTQVSVSKFCSISSWKEFDGVSMALVVLVRGLRLATMVAQQPTQCNRMFALPGCGLRIKGLRLMAAMPLA